MSKRNDEALRHWIEESRKLYPQARQRDEWAFYTAPFRFVRWCFLKVRGLFQGE